MDSDGGPRSKPRARTVRAGQPAFAPRPTTPPPAVTTDASSVAADHSAPPAGRPLANFALLLAAAWIATGALYKWLAGSPNDLPPVLHGIGDVGLVFKGAIAIELFVVASALLLPRIGWILVSLQYVAFFVVLGILINSGAESCGCFGSKVSMPPLAMLGIDGVLFALLMVSKPWSAKLWRTPVVALGAVGALALAAPWLHDRSRPSGGGSGGGDAGDGTTEGTGRPAYHILEIEDWEGMVAQETDMAQFLPDGGATLMPGTWVLYRDSCPHCAEHLRAMRNVDLGQENITLIKVPEDIDANAVVVDIKPEGPHVAEVSLEAGIDYVLQAPVDMRVEWGSPHPAYLISRLRESGEIDEESSEPFPLADAEVLRAAAAAASGQ